MVCFGGRSVATSAFVRRSRNGLDAARELDPADSIAVLLDRRAEALGEALPVPEQAGHQEGELGPELLQVVLDRRAGEAEAMPRVELADRLGGLGIGALDHLRLIQHDDVPGQWAHDLDVAREHGVGRDHHMHAGQLGPARVPVQPVQDLDAQMRARTWPAPRPSC